MKSLLSLSALFLLIATAQAEILRSRISSVEPSDDPAYPHLILLENGRVATVPSADKDTLDSLDEMLTREEVIEVDVDEKNRLQGMRSVLEEEKILPEPDPVPAPHFSYIPTNLPSLADAQAIFKRQNKRTQWVSQCYNRAHIWAFEEWKRSNFQSVKLFMFFTKRYIWDYNHKWWFHVTPMTYVSGVPMTLDRTFDKRPKTVKDWTLGFIKSRRDCKVIHKYSEYENNQETEHCYLIPVTMYFWQPRDIDNFERTGVQKTEYIKSEVNHAYWEAF